MSGPQYSVLMPAYNHEAFVAEAIESVLSAPVDDLELLVIDDGSNDGTADELQRFAADPRCRVSRQSNTGAHATLNRLLDQARGRFIFILDSDDVFEPDRIVRLAEALEAHEHAMLAASWITIVNDSGAELGVKKAWSNMPPWAPPGPTPHLSDLADPALALLEANWVATTSNFAFRRGLVTDHGLRFADLRYTHDWDFLLTAAAIGGIVLVEEPLLRYRVHCQNTIREGNKDPAADALMRLEILWTLGRHTGAIVERAVRQGFDRLDLEQRIARSQPRFGGESLSIQLRALRGSSPGVPPAYNEVLTPRHPWRDAAIDVLMSREG